MLVDYSGPADAYKPRRRWWFYLVFPKINKSIVAGIYPRRSLSDTIFSIVKNYYNFYVQTFREEVKKNI